MSRRSFWSRNFRYSPINRRVLQLALPAALGMMSQTAVLIADTSMVGVLGVVEQAATGLGGMVIWSILAFLMGGSTGVQIIVSRRFGEREFESAGQTLVSALQLFGMVGVAVTIGGFFSSGLQAQFFGNRSDIVIATTPFLEIRYWGILFYLLNFAFSGFYNGIGKTSVAMVSAAGVALSNIVLNWLLIFGNFGSPAMGVEGAALASTLAGLVGFLIYLLFTFQERFRHFFVRLKLKPSRSLARELLLLSFAPALEGFLMHFSFLFFYRLAAEISTVAVAATNIVVTIASTGFMPGFGFSIAALTLMGQGLGSGQVKLARVAVIRAATYAALLMGSMGALFILFSRELVSFFNKDEVVIEEAALALTIVAVAQVGDALQMVMSGALRGAGLVYRLMVINTVIAFGVMLPLAYLLGIYLDFGTAGLWYAAACWFVLLGTIFTMMFLKGKWRAVKV